MRQIQINLVEQGQKKGWNAVMAEVDALSMTLRSVEDLNKTDNELIFVIFNLLPILLVFYISP